MGFEQLLSFQILLNGLFIDPCLLFGDQCHVVLLQRLTFVRVGISKNCTEHLFELDLVMPLKLLRIQYEIDDI